MAMFVDQMLYEHGSIPISNFITTFETYVYFNNTSFFKYIVISLCINSVL